MVIFTQVSISQLYCRFFVELCRSIKCTQSAWNTHAKRTENAYLGLLTKKSQNRDTFILKASGFCDFFEQEDLLAQIMP